MARNGRPHIDGNGGPTDRKSACGHVVLISGCMFSGKTTELLRRLSDCAGAEVLAVKPAIDTRYDARDIVTHDNAHLAAHAVTHSSQIIDLLEQGQRSCRESYNAQHVAWPGDPRGLKSAARSKKTDSALSSGVRVVGIDEAHFFDEQLPDVVAELKRRALTVILTSLQPDSWGRPFEMNDRLAALADELVTRTARCARCAATADRTQRLTPIVGENMVGGAECYEPRCAACWRPPAVAHESSAIPVPIASSNVLHC